MNEKVTLDMVCEEIVKVFELENKIISMTNSIEFDLTKKLKLIQELNEIKENIYLMREKLIEQGTLKRGNENE